MNTSPFEPVFQTFSGMPPVFARQFLQTAPVRLEGKMHRVWHKPVLGPMFWVLGKLGVLVGRAGTEVPTTLVIELTPKGQEWRRTLYFEPPVQFNSRNTYDPVRQQVIEWVGPGKVLGMAWEIAFQSPGTLTLDTRGWVLRLGTATLSLPDWLWPWTLGRADTVQRADAEDDRVIHIELVIRHALLGEMFGYSGTFRVL